MKKNILALVLMLLSVATTFAVKPSITAMGLTTVCNGNSVTLKTDSNTTYTYQWKRNGINISGGTGPSVKADSAGYYYVVVSGVGLGSNIASDSILVTWAPIVGATVSPSSTVCAGSPITLNGTGASAYTWTDGITSYNNGVPFVPSLFNAQSLSRVEFTTSGRAYYFQLNDIDGDGKQDILALNYSTFVLSIFRNTSTSGSITSSSFAPRIDYSLGGYSALGVGDIDGDGKPDIVVSNSNTKMISILKNISTIGNISSSSFAPKVDFAAGNYPSRISIADMDGDGKPDIVVSNENTGSVSIFKNTATQGIVNTASLAAKVDYTVGGDPRYVTLVDFDGDGKRDIVTKSASTGSFCILRNTSTTGSIDASSFAPKVDFSSGSTTYGGFAIGDLDGDGKPDLVFSNSSTTKVEVFKNISSPGVVNSFSLAAKVQFTTASAPYSLSIGDIDGDGKNDILIGCGGEFSGPMTICVLNNKSTAGTINFAMKVDLSTPASPYECITMGDIDGDGRNDVVSGAYAYNLIYVLRNKSNNSFTVTGTDSNGCSNTFVQNITIKPVTSTSIIASFGNTTVCAGSSVVLHSPDTATSYRWLRNNVAIAGAISNEYLADQSGSYRVLSITNGICRDTSLAIAVVVQPALTNNTITASQSVCSGSTIGALTGSIPTGGSGTYTYTWQTSATGTGSWNTVASTQNYSPSGVVSNTWFRRYIISGSCIIADTSPISMITILPKPKAGFTISNDTQCFNGNTFVLTDTSTITSGTLFRIWSHSDGTNDTSIIANKSYTQAGAHLEKLVSVSDQGCRDSVNRKVFLLPSVNITTQPICMVTIDSATNKNKIIWERLNKPGQSSYLIYKETNVSNTYAFTGSSSADSIGLFIDLLSNPDMKSDRYKLVAIDTCGNASPQSAAHKTMHLTVNAGSGGVWNLIWESYDGLPVNTIHIYRGSSPATLSLLNSVQGSITSYTDLTPPAGPLYYMTSIDFGVSCDPSRMLKTVYSSSQSNIVSTLASGVSESSTLEGIKIFPNPVDDQLYITSTSGNTVSVSLYDAIGRLVLTSDFEGEQSIIDMSELQHGLYLVEIRSLNNLKYQKVIKR